MTPIKVHLEQNVVESKVEYMDVNYDMDQLVQGAFNHQFLLEAS